MPNIDNITPFPAALDGEALAGQERRGLERQEQRAMKITLDYRNPTPSHCDVAVFINGALAGVLTLRQDELVDFQMVLADGLKLTKDEFLATGNPDPRAEL